MKKCKCLLIAALFLSVTPLYAGIRYEFRESVRTEETSRTTNLVARAVIEGEMSRMEVLSGNRYDSGTYILTHGDQRIYIVDPEEKSYVEYATNSEAVNPERFQIANPNVSFIEVPEPSPVVIAGFPTKHYRLTLDYDLTVMIGTISVNMDVNTVIDKWTTTAFDHLISQYRENVDELKTGNPQIDSLIETEATKFKGLALKQRTQITTKSKQQSRNSNVNLPSTRKRTKEMVVSKIEEVDISPNYFAIPVDYTKNESASAPATTTQYLTMSPDGQ